MLYRRLLPLVLLAYSLVLRSAVTMGAATGADGMQPSEAVKKFQLADSLKIELVVAEPDVVDPVAVAWDEFGRMFVVEMRDYPHGPAEGEPHLSRIKRLEDRDRDGRPDAVTIFADQLPYANGVMPWQGGIIVTAAPDLWFLKDTDGDGHADLKEQLFTGFKEGNPQLRVNHPTLGMDNWIYVANGLSGGEVRRPDQEGSPKIPIPQMDFRFRPDRSEYEATAGNAQFGLAFDDIANRFVCSNRQHVAHVVFPDRYLKRNPHLGVAKTVLDIPDHGAAARIFPLAMTRTTAVEHAGTFTAACGLVVYRGSALPQEFRGNSFTCDPTGYLVHRDVLVPAGATFTATRASDEARREFLASTDEWFRPVNLANGPDGALYVVDMYRETIEHPQYMPKGLAETLDLRKGDDRGRIWRIAARDFAKASSGPWPGELGIPELVRLLEHPDSWWRETAQRLLVERRDESSAAPLIELAQSAPNPLARIHALWTLEGVGRLAETELSRALRDSSAEVREHAVRLSERNIRDGNLPLIPRSLAADPSARVRFQLALSLGEQALSSDPQRHRETRVDMLAQIVQLDAEDSWAQVAVLSSAADVAGDLWRRLGSEYRRTASPAKANFVGKLASIIGSRGDETELVNFVLGLATTQEPSDVWWQLAATTGLAESLQAKGKNLDDVLTAMADRVQPAVRRIRALWAGAGEIAGDSKRLIPERTAAIRVVAASKFDDVAELFRRLLEVSQPQEVQLAAVHALGAKSDAKVGNILLDGWASHSPPVRRAVLEAMFSRLERIMLLLDAIDAGSVKAAELDTQRHHQLLTHSNKEIKQRAEKIFEQEGTPNRKEVIESYRTVLAQSGDSVRGREVFQKACASCHQIQGQGHRVGPELTGLRTRNKEALLMDILDPNRAMEPNYANYLIATKDGRVLSGIIASETATSITLRRAEGVEDTFLRQDIEQIRASGQSLMPEGLERTVTQTEMLDLLEFLKSVP